MEHLQEAKSLFTGKFDIWALKDGRFHGTDSMGRRWVFDQNIIPYTAIPSGQDANKAICIRGKAYGNKIKIFSDSFHNFRFH